MSKELGSITRTGIAVVSGYFLGKAGLEVETLEDLANSLDAIGAVLAVIITQIWSLIEKIKSKKEVKELETFIEERQYND